MDKHIAALEKLHNHASDRRYLSAGELEAIRAAIDLMRGQSEVAAWQVRVFYPREQKWSKWQDISQDSYEAAKREGCYHEYTTIELRELVPAQNDPADEQ